MKPETKAKKKDLAAGTTCPIPISDYPHVVLAHGGGGTLMRELIEKMFVASFSNEMLESMHDSAVIPSSTRRFAFTTDSYVVSPLFFPGGDIGSMAVYGTVNDLAMAGARPLYLSAGFILEEGLPMETLWRVVESMKVASEKAGVRIITGDTKVVDKGKGDGIFINTAGIGVIEHDLEIIPQKIRPGDSVILNGDLGRHGIAVMALREGLSFEGRIESDLAPVSGTVERLLKAGIRIHCLRDLTRGGLASALNEVAKSARRSIRIEEADIPVSDEVQGACEILGLDPLYVANEGRFIVFVSPKDAKSALEVMREENPRGRIGVIGFVEERDPGRVMMRTRIGTQRIVGMISGEQLPRIC